METQRQEIVRVVAAAGEPLTRTEIFEGCKNLDDVKQLSVTLAQMVKAGMLKRAGDREQAKGLALALYGPGTVPAGSKKAAAKRQAGGKTKLLRPSARITKPLPSVAAKKPAHKAKPKAKRPSLADLPPLEPLDGFRCGLFSDGSFSINAAEGQITLTAAEYHAMVRYNDSIVPQLPGADR